MPDFIDTLTFLSDGQRQLLREADLDSPAAFEHVEIPHLTAPPFNLTLGKASRLLTSARAGTSTPIANTVTHNVTIAPPTLMSARVTQALEEVAADPGKAGLLVELGVARVVLGVDDKVSPALTLSMRAQEAAGAPVGATWQGQRVVDTVRLASPTVYCSPRDGSPLQAGAGEVSGVMWGELGLDGLRVAAFGYQEGMFEGRPEEAVFAALRGGVGGEASALRERVITRMKALRVNPESLDRVVVFNPAPPRVEVGFHGDRQVPKPGSLVGNLRALLQGAFSADELRRFITHNVGRDFAAGLPGPTASLADLAFATAEKLVRHGYVTRDLRNALRSERPHKASEIDAVFGAAGV